MSSLNFEKYSDILSSFLLLLLLLLSFFILSHNFKKKEVKVKQPVQSLKINYIDIKEEKKIELKEQKPKNESPKIENKKLENKKTENKNVQKTLVKQKQSKAPLAKPIQEVQKKQNTSSLPQALAQKQNTKEVVQNNIAPKIQNNATNQNLSSNKVFIDKFLNEVQASLQYPSNAKKANIQGMVNVKVFFDKNGKVLNVILADNKSNTILAKAALATVNKVKTKWAPNLQLNSEQTLNIPIVFKLK